MNTLKLDGGRQRGGGESLGGERPSSASPTQTPHVHVVHTPHVLDPAFGDRGR